MSRAAPMFLALASAQLLAATAPRPADAEPLVVEASGVVEYSDGDWGYAWPCVEVGGEFSVRAVVDGNAVDTDQDPSRGLYLSEGELDLRVGPFQFLASSLRIEVLDDGPNFFGDSIGVRAEGVTPEVPGPWCSGGIAPIPTADSVTLTFAAPVADEVLDSDDLLQAVASVALLRWGSIEVQNRDLVGIDYFGGRISGRVEQVPEAGALPSGIAAVVGSALLARRKRNGSR